MRYLGGKSRLAKEIAGVLSGFLGSAGVYVEPFVGSAAVAEKLAGLSPIPMLLADSHPDLILLYRAMQNGYVPPDAVSEQEYEQAKQLQPCAYRGFVGFACSYGGKWFGGYARGEERNYALEGKRSLLRTVAALQGARFLCCDYRELVMPGRALIYADPPYANTTRYRGGQFDSDALWDWARRQSASGHTVIVSEYAAPDDFDTLWEKPHTTSIRPRNGNEQRIERLFKLRGY